MAIDNDAAAVGPNDREHEAELLDANAQECHATNIQQLCEVLSFIQANYDQFAERYYDIINKLNQLEMDCINVLQPTDMISMERHVEHIREMKANLTLMMSNNGIQIHEK